MDPKRRKKEEGKQAKTADPLEVQSILFEIALGLSVEEIIAWCNLNKFFAKMCETYFPGEKLYQLGLLDLEVLLNETVEGLPGWGVPKLSEEEKTEHRKKEIERRKNEVVQMAKDFNSTIFLNEPKALALHKAMLSTRESQLFFLRHRLDVYFGFAKNEVWESFSDNMDVRELPLSLVRVRSLDMWKPLVLPKSEEKKKQDYTWEFYMVLSRTIQEMLKPSGQRVAKGATKNKVIDLLKDEMKSAKFVMALFPKDAKPIKKDAHMIQELFRIRKSVSFKDFQDHVDIKPGESLYRKKAFGIAVDSVRLEFEGSFLSQKWEVTLDLKAFFAISQQQLSLSAYKFYFRQEGKTTVDDMRWQQAWFTLGPVLAEPFVSEMLVNAGLRKRLIFPDY